MGEYQVGARYLLELCVSSCPLPGMCVVFLYMHDMWILGAMSTERTGSWSLVTDGGFPPSPVPTYSYCQCRLSAGSRWEPSQRVQWVENRYCCEKVSSLPKYGHYHASWRHGWELRRSRDV